MKYLYLLRHAKSDWSDPALGDFDRPLSKRGRRAAPQMGRELKLMKVNPDLVLCSTAKRAVETYGLVAGKMKFDGTLSTDGELYLAAAEKLLSILRSQSDALSSVMIIGHNPGMENLARLLAGAQSNSLALQSLKEKFPTAALAVFELPITRWQDLEPGTGLLTDFVRPRDLDA